LESNTVSVRSRSRGDLGSLPFEAFQTQLLQEIKSHGQKEITIAEAAKC
jgi:hypothetical protein